MPVDFWLYRCGIEQWSSDGHRAIFTETWLSTQPEISPTSSAVGLLTVANRVRNFWGFGGPITQYVGASLVEKLWPSPRWVTRFGFNALGSTPQLNPNAPEAAFRLQRVGAGGAKGRMMLPILDDSVFTDLPHRRHIDLATWAPRLDHGGFSWPQTFVSPEPRTYINVIFHRRTMTWTPVTSYALLENPIRRWARWRDNPLPFPNPPSLSTVPDEIT